MGQHKGDALILVAALIWGVAFYFQKSAMSFIGPLLFLALRGTLAALVLTPFAMFEHQGKTGLPTQVVYWAILGGIVFFIAGSVQQIGIISASVTNTGFLTALYVVATPFVYWIFKRTPPPKIIWLAVSLSFIGTWALSGGNFTGFSTGEWLIVGSAALWACHFVITGEASNHNRPLTYTCLLFYVVGTLAWLGAIAIEPIIWSDIMQSLDAILYVGILSSALTFAVMAIALRHISAPRASVLLSIETVFAAAAGYLLLDERLHLIGWCGALLILAAIIILRTKPAAT